MAAQAPDDEFGAAKRLTASFYYQRILPRVAALEKSVCAPSDALSDFPDAEF